MAIELTLFLVSFLSLGISYLMVALSEFNFTVYWYRKGKISTWMFWKHTKEDKQFLKDAPEYSPSTYQVVLAKIYEKSTFAAYFLLQFLIGVLICNWILGKSLFAWIN